MAAFTVDGPKIICRILGNDDRNREKAASGVSRVSCRLRNWMEGSVLQLSGRLSPSSDDVLWTARRRRIRLLRSVARLSRSTSASAIRILAVRQRKDCAKKAKNTSSPNSWWSYLKLVDKLIDWASKEISKGSVPDRFKHVFTRSRRGISEVQNSRWRQVHSRGEESTSVFHRRQTFRRAQTPAFVRFTSLYSK
jgi:hypothetical protein